MNGFIRSARLMLIAEAPHVNEYSLNLAGAGCPDFAESEIQNCWMRLSL